MVSTVSRLYTVSALKLACIQTPSCTGTVNVGLHSVVVHFRLSDSDELASPAVQLHNTFFKKLLFMNR